ncbi:MAG: hypothetical protein LBG58_15110 [Planctomycetaceae bacterium]|nr:hypothetical protein [Planctomycetaceae bacterium]
MVKNKLQSPKNSTDILRILLFFRVYGEYTAHTATLEMSLQELIKI